MCLRSSGPGGKVCTGRELGIVRMEDFCRIKVSLVEGPVKEEPKLEGERKKRIKKIELFVN